MLTPGIPYGWDQDTDEIPTQIAFECSCDLTFVGTYWDHDETCESRRIIERELKNKSNRAVPKGLFSQSPNL